MINSAALRKFRVSFLVIISFSSSFSWAQTGKDGNRQISASGTVINTYTTLTADAVAGSLSITVAASGLNGASFTGPLSAGDLIMIIQQQGATISYPDDSSYGSILSYGGCGHYELCQVAAVPGSSTISLTCGLRHDYTVNGKTQIIRVPRYNRLTVNTGASITAPTWNGSTGGIVVIEADSDLVISSGANIDLNGKGFRGGILSENLSALGVLNYRWPTGDYGAEKGESVVGYQVNYDSLSGRYCKGAPANGGGGGSGHNCGGGGGANAGDPSAWSGKGIPDVSVATYASAWNLEYPGFATSASSGGGRGGYSFSSSNQDALTVGNYNPAWGGDYRRDNGGRGGRPLDYSTGRIYMGGGGGAGDQNDNRGGNGGSGGGIVFIATRGNVSGTGSIQVNGNNGFNSVSSFNGNDAAGGGGAGGTVIIDAGGIVSGISVSANGGRGGNQNVGLFQNDAYGPGGGGGGGYIGISNGNIIRSATGGANGVTNSAGLTEFPPNGATKGASGLANEQITSYRLTAVGDTVCFGSACTLTVTVSGTLPLGSTLNWYTQPFDGAPVASGQSFTTPNLISTTTYYVGACPGYYRVPVLVVVDSITAAVNLPSSLPCSGSSAVFSASVYSSSSTVTDWSWNFNDGSPLLTGQSVQHSFDTAGVYQVEMTATDVLGCQASSITTVTIASPPVIMLSAIDSAGCAPFNTGLMASAAGGLSYSWNFGDSTSGNGSSVSHTYLSSGSYTVLLTVSTATCDASQTLQITAFPVPDATITPSSANGCYPLTVSFGHQQYTGATYSWDFGDGTTAAGFGPSHVFGTAGTFPVVLTVSQNGCTGTDTAYITASAPFSISVNHNDGCISTPILFQASPVGSIISYQWSFGDGSNSSVNPTSHSYTLPGVYPVTLIATDNNGCQAAYSDSVLVQSPPIVSFTNNPSAGCDTVIVQFTNGTSGASTYSWDFGDGTSSTAVSPVHVYTSPGSYSVYLSAVSALGCTSQSLPGSIVSVYISPVVQVACSDTLICAGDCISFSDQSTGAPIQWQWSFSGAVPGTSGVSNVGQVCYNTPGDYDVTLTAGNNACSASRTFTDFVHVTDCSLAPVAAFVCSDSSFCVNGCTSFLSLAQNATGWNWSFPGATPSFSTAANPSGICYPAVGDYPVILQVTNPAGSDQITVTNLIHIASVPPIPSFIQSGDTLLAPQGYAGYQWYYNGSLIVGSNSYRYLALQSGNYSVAVTNSSGCRAISQPQHVSLVGLDELIADFNLRIYPVPFNDQLIIRYYGQQPVSCFILLTDALGRTVIIHDFKFNTRTAEHTIDTGNLPAGTYVLVISDNIRRVVRKLIKM